MREEQLHCETAADDEECHRDALSSGTTGGSTSRQRDWHVYCDSCVCLANPFQGSISLRHQSAAEPWVGRRSDGRGHDLSHHTCQRNGSYT
jgi:hypothetical protein